MSDKYPMIDTLLGAYFHQDWNCIYKSAEALISDFARVGGKEDIESTITELKTLLKEEHRFKDWEKIIYDDFGCEYSLRSRNLEPTEWLKKIQNQLEDELALAKTKEEKHLSQEL